MARPLGFELLSDLSDPAATSKEPSVWAGIRHSLAHLGTARSWTVVGFCGVSSPRWNAVVKPRVLGVRRRRPLRRAIRRRTNQCPRTAPRLFGGPRQARLCELAGTHVLCPYFTAPAVRPLTKNRCRAKKTTSGTMMVMKDPAATRFQPCAYCPSRPYSACVSTGWASPMKM